MTFSGTLSLHFIYRNIKLNELTLNDPLRLIDCFNPPKAERRHSEEQVKERDILETEKKTVETPEGIEDMTEEGAVAEGGEREGAEGERKGERAEGEREGAVAEGKEEITQEGPERIEKDTIEGTKSGDHSPKQPSTKGQGLFNF